MLPFQGHKFFFLMGGKCELQKLNKWPFCGPQAIRNGKREYGILPSQEPTQVGVDETSFSPEKAFLP
jgi:hypothetical protein